MKNMLQMFAFLLFSLTARADLITEYTEDYNDDGAPATYECIVHHEGFYTTNRETFANSPKVSVIVGAKTTKGDLVPVEKTHQSAEKKTYSFAATEDAVKAQVTFRVSVNIGFDRFELLTVVPSGSNYVYAQYNSMNFFFQCNKK